MSCRTSRYRWSKSALRVQYFDYEAKYQHGGAIETCPAEVDSAYKTVVQTSAIAAATAIGFNERSYCRIDFRENSDGIPTFIEANWLPGLTLTSSFLGLPPPRAFPSATCVSGSSILRSSADPVMHQRHAHHHPLRRQKL